MSNTNTGGPAFPTTVRDNYDPETGAQWSDHINPGMTLRDYAAIHLKVPSSGTDWLDEMIMESLRNDDAAKAMVGIIAHPEGPAGLWDKCAYNAYEMADAMLKARQV